jgi:hypothetical protein
MNKTELLRSITQSVHKKHPWRISQESYLKLFGQLPQEFLNERLAYDNLVEKHKQFKLCQLVLTEVKIEIKLSLDELITWELSLDKWEAVRAHNILPGDIKKLLKEYDE